ncbi:hypothetical protein PCURB6_09860 [Paenibacillus curdlanolyticus]|nr:hypothetical protein PCURB6_09860 [Paenibacillus curdlanolyticus]
MQLLLYLIFMTSLRSRFYFNDPINIGSNTRKNKVNASDAVIAVSHLYRQTSKQTQKQDYAYEVVFTSMIR